MAVQGKKLIIVNILEILKKYTDETHSLQQKDIIDILKRDYDMTADRKTIRRNILDLTENGFNIDYREIPRGVDGDEENLVMTDFRMIHDFTDAELMLLIDGILFSGHIPNKQKKELIKKLEELGGSYFNSGAANILTEPSDENVGKELFYNIEIINEAINNDVCLEFNYLEYRSDKKLHKRITKNNKIRRFTVNPYSIAATNGRYYLICNNTWFEGISHFRIDRITGIKIIPEKRRPINEIKGCEKGFSLSKHMAEHINMFSDQAERVTFRAKKVILSELFDWFGRDMTFTDETDDEITVSVFASHQDMRLWATEFSRNVTVLYPKELVDDITNDLSEALKRYGKK